MTNDELYAEVLKNWNTLADAVEKLYFSGYWHCDRPVDEKALWTAVRDAAKIPPGMTGYTLGEDRSLHPEAVLPKPTTAMIEAGELVLREFELEPGNIYFAEAFDRVKRIYEAMSAAYQTPPQK